MEKHAAMEKEYIRHEIGLEMENLKFYQGFYLPIGTGIIILVFTKEEIPRTEFFYFLTVSILAICYLLVCRALIKRRLREFFRQL